MTKAQHCVYSRQTGADVTRLAERDERVAAEHASGAREDPNVSLLGDPTPQRRALIQQQEAEPPPLSRRNRQKRDAAVKNGPPIEWYGGSMNEATRSGIRRGSSG